MVKNIKRAKNDLLAMPIFKTVFKNKAFQRTIQIITLALFVYAIYYGYENPTKENTFTKNVFWGLFWSFFMVLTLTTFGRIFCGICPHGFLGKYITRYGMNLEMPKFLKNRYIGITLLVVGWWGVYYTFPGALKIPLATAIMFTVLTIVAFVMFFLYKDMSYCKYICPIGNLTKAYQKVSFTKLGTNSKHCASCRTFECNTACTYNLKPFTFDKKNSMDDCSLCMDCTRACDSVDFKIIPPTSTLYKKTKVEKSDIWVYILVFASITFTMSFHHALGRTNIADLLPWATSAQYVGQYISIKGVDFVGFFAYLYSLALVVSTTFAGIFLASKALGQKFSSTFSSLGYAYAPLFIIASLGHLLSGFFTKTYSNVLNGFIQGFSLDINKVQALASRGDSWLMAFELFVYLAMILGLVILYKRVNLFKVSKMRKALAYIAASSLILLYLGLSMYKVYAFKTYGVKQRAHSTHTHMKK